MNTQDKRTEQNTVTDTDTKGMHRRLMREVRADGKKLILLLVLGAVSALAIGASAWAIANITNEVFLNGAACRCARSARRALVGRRLSGRSYHVVDDGAFSPYAL